MSEDTVTKIRGKDDVTEWYTGKLNILLYEIHKYKHFGYDHMLLTCDIEADYYTIDALNMDSQYLREVHVKFGNVTVYDAALKNKDSIFLYLYESKLDINIPMII